MNDVSDLLEEARLRVEESAQRLDAIQGRVDLDPEKLDETVSRMDLIGRLKKKYGPAVEDVIAHHQKIRGELKHLENAEERTHDLEQRLAQAEKKLSADCAALSKARSSAAKKLSESAEKEFKDLGLSRASLEIAVSRHDVESPSDGSKKPAYASHGYDNIEFLFTPNPGEGKKSLAGVASGGELSRVMLALKTVLAKSDPVGTMVFDEIDAGVGGDLGTAIGRKMSRLGKTHQVLCITHLASIAACGDTHFFVEKEVKSGRTRTIVRKLDDDKRIGEVARMLGGAEEKSGARSTSLQHAKALLSELKV
jgi:DNA repair protein RecN (Recombination protein N)